jgi:hypothetical protein
VWQNQGKESQKNLCVLVPSWKKEQNYKYQKPETLCGLASSWLRKKIGISFPKPITNTPK